MPYTVSGQERSSFARNGYCGPFDLCSPERMEEHRAALEALIAERSRPEVSYSAVQPVNGDEGAVETLYDAHLDNAVVRALTTDAAVVRRAEALLASAILLWRSTFWIKHGGARRLEWHQDTFKEEGFGSFPNVNAWIAIDDATEDNCVHLVGGSHASILPLESFRASGYLSALRESPELPPPPQYPQESVVRMTLRPGQFFLFDGRILHGSPPNRSQRRRAGLAARFVPAGTELRGLCTPMLKIDPA